MHAPNRRNTYSAEPTLELSTQIAAPRRLRGRRLTGLLALAMLGAHLIGCRQTSDHSQGVELVLSSGTPTATMTFELRFDTPMVGESQVGIPGTNSPLVVTPPLTGNFTWSSPRHGVFVPTEPFALDTRYDLRLRPGLQCLDGKSSKAQLQRTFATPPFGIIGTYPQKPDTNAASEPEVKIAFNADIRAREAERFLYFRDADGRRIPADVRQALVEEEGYQLGGPCRIRTWQQQFDRLNRAGADGDDGYAEANPTNELANVLLATPRQALPLGKDWRLVLSAGAPAQDGALRLRAAAEVPVGDVTPFVVTEATAHHYVNSGSWIRLAFSKPVPESLTNRIAGWLELNPTPTNLAVQSGWRSLMLKGDFKGETWYTLKLLPGFESTEPFKLTGSNAFTLKMPRIAPRLYFPAFSRDQMAGGSRSFPLLAVNVPEVRVRAKLLDPQTAIHALRGYGSYFVRWDERRQSDSWDEPYRRVNYNLVPGRTIFNEQLDLNAAPDVTKRVELSWDRMLAGRKTGVVFLDADPARSESDSQPSLGTQALIQLTDLGVVWKKALSGVDVFVFSHATGQPVAGATARFFSDENEPLCQTLTDAGGQAHLPANTNAEWVAVQHGDDFHAALLNQNRVWLYRFDLPCTGSDTQEAARRVMMFSDRNVYRPGEEMHLEALVREWSDQGLSVPAGLTGTLDCVDTRGRQFFQTNAVFSVIGSWSVQVPLPIASRGTYSARLHLGTNEYLHVFQVQDFQPSAFEIALKSKSVFAADEKIAVPVSAHYLFGKRLTGARVAWSLEAEDTEFRPARFGGFTFRRTDSEARFGRGRSSLVLSGQGMLSGASNYVITAELPTNAAAPQPRTASLLVEVTDLNQQTLSHRAEFVRHSSDFYLGLRQGTQVLNEGEALPLEAVTVRADGQPWPEAVKAQLRLQRIDWLPVRIQGAGRSIRYRNEAVVTNVFQEQIELSPIQLPTEVDSDVSGNALPGLPPLPAGHYLVEVTANDAGGRPVISSLGFDVSARAEMASNYRNDVQLTLKPGRTSYAPGETAELLVESPFTGTALVTVEREKVLRSFTTRLEGNAPAIRIPLTAADVPNVFVSVTLVRGADECPRKTKEPEYRIGYCELKVTDPQSRLRVTVTPAATNCLPAQPVEVTVQVSGTSGEPVPGAEVVLYAVDDGILQLTEYGPPDPHGFFYATRPLGVQTSISLPNLLAEDSEELSFQNKGYLGGGGGSERVRSNSVRWVLLPLCIQDCQFFIQQSPAGRNLS
jgi:alpha-2-macroglobulin